MLVAGSEELRRTAGDPECSVQCGSREKAACGFATPVSAWNFAASNDGYWSTNLRSQSPGDLHPNQIVPCWPRIGGSARKGPKPKAFRIDLGKVSQTLHHTNWIRMKPRFAIVEMLNHVEGNVTDEWLGVDHQPGLPLGAQHISGMKISSE
jgi:hypothetical protein